MRFTFLIIFVFILSLANIQAQQYYTVIAKHGLSLREQPSIESTKLALLPFNSGVEMIEETTIELSLIDNGKRINGHWIRVKTEDNIKGYVFDAYLLARANSPNNYIECYEKPCENTFDFKDCIFTIYDYEADGNLQYFGDTILFEEVVFNTISDKLIQVQSIKGDSAQVYFSYIERIDEQYQYLDSDRMDAEEWRKARVSWKGQSNFQQLKAKQGFYRMPLNDFSNREAMLKQKMNLRDTLIDLSGESDNIATLIYQEKPCCYLIDSVLFKIIVYSHGNPNIHYLRIVLSYGC